MRSGSLHSPGLPFLCSVLLALPGVCGASSLQPLGPPDNALAPQQVCADGACTLTYEAAFFERYAPVTALDMVGNLPGFNLRNGDSSARGFGGAAGNVILNGARISAKSESISDILGRIPFADVERIEVIRGQVGGLDLRGESVVANVVRRGESASGAWNAGLATYQPTGGLFPAADVSYSTSSALGEATLALSAARGRFVTERRENLFENSLALSEQRYELFKADDEEFGGSLNASTSIVGWRINANFGRFDFETDGGELSRRYPVASADSAFSLYQGLQERQSRNELGMDAERALGEAWRLKLIGLYRDEDFESEFLPSATD